MAIGAIVMDNGDWARFKQLMEAVVKPVQDSVTNLKTEIGDLRQDHKDSFKDLPCNENTIKLNTIETRIANGREQKKDTRDFVFRVMTIGGTVLLISIVVLGFLYKVGFFKALAK